MRRPPRSRRAMSGTRKPATPSLASAPFAACLMSTCWRRVSASRQMQSLAARISDLKGASIIAFSCDRHIVPCKNMACSSADNSAQNPSIAATNDLPDSAVILFTSAGMNSLPRKLRGSRFRAGLLTISSNGTSPIGLASVWGLVNQWTAPFCSRLPNKQSSACRTSAVPVFGIWAST